MHLIKSLMHVLRMRSVHANYLDTQIEESQRAMDAEIELAKAGFANNVDAKRKELEDLKRPVNRP